VVDPSVLDATAVGLSAAARAPSAHTLASGSPPPGPGEETLGQELELLGYGAGSDPSVH